MYKIIYMKADFEPWWQFEGWDDYIVEQWEYDNEQEFNQALQMKLEEMRIKYPHEKMKDCYYAFWDEKELEYCESCDEDAQVYHGILTKVSVSV